MKRQVAIAALFLSGFAHAEITLSGKPDNNFTQDAHQHQESRQKLITEAKIDRDSFSQKVQNTCDTIAPRDAVAKFKKMTTQLLGSPMSFEDAGYTEENYRKVITFTCYKGANWTINGLDKQMESQMLQSVKDRESAAVTTNDKAAAAGFKIAIEATQQGIVAARK
ncbi:hypothetical protein IBT49_15310 [Erwinia sp. S63]|uniref:hypothetical protein n=1 Tax=Erwinia sp. S63 TaxID=2769341 RepID=UPI00190CEB87|nr:hypothetical protein [Erwinia sp. S63]MBK0097352.1 hypothetical protein [Erwinia sp. S63]